MSKLPPITVPDLGGYLREQRQHARLSLRQLSDVAGISNPYLSQIERGLKKPSAEILQSLAKGLRISAESLYVRAGLLEEHLTGGSPSADVRAAVLSDAALTDRQRAVLLDVYESFVGIPGPAKSANGPATSANGPATSANGPATSANGPATSANGPAAARPGPTRTPKTSAASTTSAARTTKTTAPRRTTAASAGTTTTKQGD